MKNTITEYSPFIAAMEKAKDEANFIPDASTKDGYQASKQIALKLTKSLTALEKCRKEIKAPVIERGKAIDSEASEIKEVLESLREPHQIAYKEADAAEKRRKEAIEAEIQERIDGMKQCLDHARNMSPDDIDELIDGMSRDEMAGFGNREAEALKVRNDVISDLKRMANDKREQAAADEARRLADERIEQERAALAEERRLMQIEQAKKDEEARVIREKEQAELEELRALKREAELAKQRAEEEERKAKERAEFELKREEDRKKAKEDAEIAAKQAAEDARLAEIKRQEEERARIAAEIAKREADKSHISNIRKEAKESLIELCGLSEDDAKKVVLAVHDKQIKNVQINY